MNDKIKNALDKIKTADDLKTTALNDIAEALNEVIAAVSIRDNDDEDVALVQFYADHGKLFFRSEYARN